MTPEQLVIWEGNVIVGTDPIRSPSTRAVRGRTSPEDSGTKGTATEVATTRGTSGKPRSSPNSRISAQSAQQATSTQTAIVTRRWRDNGRGVIAR